MKKWHGMWLTWLLLATMACVGGKGTGVLQVTSPEMPPPPKGPVVSEPYRIMRGDILNVTFPLNPELDLKPVLVRPDGRIVLNLVGEVNAFGMTVPELQQAIGKQYREAIAKTGYSKVLKPNDYFDLKFVYNPELNIGVRIQSDGKVSLPLVGEVQAADLTPAQLRQKLIEAIFPGYPPTRYRGLDGYQRHRLSHGYRRQKYLYPGQFHQRGRGQERWPVGLCGRPGGRRPRPFPGKAT